MNNLQIRSAIWESGFKKYQIAEKMGITENSFSRLFRQELSAEQGRRVYAAIDELNLARAETTER